MRKLIYAFLLFAAVAQTAYGQTSDDDHSFRVAKNMEVFNAIYRDLDMMYVDTLNADEVVGVAIDAMLSSLDPYTEYYPSDKEEELKMMMTGKYAGIGSLIRYNQALKQVVIDEPYEKMPAAEAGLKKGDIILSIDDSVMTDKSVTYVSEHLRGEAGTTFVLKIKRPTTGKKMTFKMTRRAIQMPSISYYGIKEDGIGYLNLTSFNEGCSKEVRRAFLEMKRQGMRAFVLDLRNNGGGAVQEAVSIVNMFVPKGRTIVRTQGKLARASGEYKTTVEPIDTVMPIVVLVNSSTASASEITCGSMQDLDRAVVMGTRTYGKGLVQLPNLPLPYNGNLKLTTGKYYIPSGRCIQAINYKKRREENGGKRGGSLYGDRVPDSLANVFYTANGREVRDGGGIKPDVEILPDSLPNIAYYLASSGLDSTEVMLNWELDYMKKHPSIAPASDFEITDAEYEDFKQCVLKSGFNYDRESGKYLEDLVKWAKFEGYYDGAKAEFDALEAKLTHNLAHELDYNKETIKQLLAADLVSVYYYNRGAVENALRHDKQWKEAVRLLNHSEEYEAILKGS
jgi:carboxyl-terminal processing protease